VSEGGLISGRGVGVTRLSQNGVSTWGPMTTGKNASRKSKSSKVDPISLEEPRTKNHRRKHFDLQQRGGSLRTRGTLYRGAS